MERFTVHADVFTQRSRFFATARKSEWLAGDSSKPVDLSDEDPDIFQAYLNCVYVGAETLEEIPGSFESEVRESTGGFPDVWVKNNGKEVITKETLIGYLRYSAGSRKSTFTALVFLLRHSHRQNHFHVPRSRKSSCQGQRWPHYELP